MHSMNKSNNANIRAEKYFLRSQVDRWEIYARQRWKNFPNNFDEDSGDK